MSMSRQTLIAATAALALSAVSADAGCRHCGGGHGAGLAAVPAAHTLVKTNYKYNTVHQVRHVTRYNDVVQVRNVTQVREVVQPRYVDVVHRTVNVTRVVPITHVHNVTRIIPITRVNTVTRVRHIDVVRPVHQHVHMTDYRAGVVQYHGGGAYALGAGYSPTGHFHTGRWHRGHCGHHC